MEASEFTKPETPDGPLNKTDIIQSEEDTQTETDDSIQEDSNGPDLSNQKEQEGGKEDAAEEARRLAEEELDKLESLVEAQTYIIGKPPELGGQKNEFSIYTQEPLGYVTMLRFYGLVGKTIAEAVKAGGVVDLGDAFNNTSGNVQDRAKQIMEQSFNDAGSFATLLFQIIAYSPDFLLEFYCLALEVPTDERKWAKAVMEQPWRPEQNKWGLQRQHGQVIIERFIDQNYDEVRDFFGDLFRGVSKRIRKQERKRRKSTSDQSK